MCEWHITPEYIINNWTDELLSLMVEKLSERKRRELEAINKPLTNAGKHSGTDNIVSDEQLFKSLGNKIRVVKKRGV